MDPLSISASIIAIGALVIKSLRIILKLKGAPTEVNALINEVSDLSTLVKDTEAIIKRRQSLDSSASEVQSLADVLGKSKKTFQLLNDFLQLHLMRDEIFEKETIGFRVAWLRERSQISKFQRQISSNRDELSRALQVANLSIGSRVELAVAKILTFTEESSAQFAEKGQRTAKTTKILAGEVRDLRHVVSLHTRGMRRLRKIDHQSGRDVLDHSYPNESIPAISKKSTGIEVQLLWRPRCLCLADCPCACHRISYGRSPKVFHKLLGMLFWGYCGLPVVRPQCDYQNCHRKSVTSIQLSYFFPGWFVKRMVAVTYRSVPMQGLQICLKTSRVVDNGALIFKMTQTRNLEGIKCLLDQGAASPYDTGHLDGFTALHLAVQRGFGEIAQFLIYNGADRNAINTSLSTPASLAWDHILGNALPMQTLEQLREAFSDREFLEEYDFSFLHQVVLGIKPVDLHQALNQYPALVDHADTKGNTPLLWAARRGEVGHVKALLKAGANFKSMNNRGSDPLSAAVMNGRLECMKVLLSAGAVLQLDSQNKSALHSACNARDDVEYVKVLLGRETNINHKDIFDRSPLNFASWRNHFRVVKYLLEAGADIETRDFFGATALLRAVQYAAVDVARVLMDYGANPNAVDNNSQTILHRAALSRNNAILEFLATRLELSSVDIEAKNNSDLTARECLLQLQPPVELLEAFESLTQAIRKAIEIAKAERRQLSLKEACYRVIELDPSPSGTGSSTPLPFADAVEYQHTSGSDDDSIRWFLSRRGGPRERTIDRLKRKARHVQERGKSWTDKYSRKFRSFSSLGGSSAFKGSFDC